MRRWWLLVTTVVLTWQTLDPAFTVEVQHRHQGELTVLTHTTDTTYRHPYPRDGQNCYRARYVMPQVTAWTAWTCVRWKQGRIEGDQG